MRRFHLLFSAHPARVILETLLIELFVWWLLALLLENLFKTHIPVGQSVVVMGVLAMPWCALRLSRPKISWWRKRLREAWIVGILCLAQGIVIVFDKTTLKLVARLSSDLALQARFLAAPMQTILEITIISGLLFLGNDSIFLLIRAIGRIWASWNHLRRTQLQWSLTHAHAMIVGLGTILLMFMAAIVLALSAHGISFARLIIPIFAIVGVLGILAILAVIPPSALFSYIVVRQTVQRIQMLTVATSALRAGNYEVRVPVRGEDEVAQLQADFNAMATNLERVMRELQLERDTVSGLLQSRRELVANASHELRTPVATLRGSLETTLLHWEEHSENSLQQDLLVMENEVLHLQTLVENLFALARADVGRLSLRCEPTDIGILVRRIVENRATLAWKASKIEVLADIQNGVPKALIDSARVEQILQNLLHSAIRHTPPGGIIVIVVGEQAGSVIIQVKDTGEGIASEHLPAIWEPAYQKNNGKGLQETAGLGLALVKEWTEAMGGQISVESVEGEGSCFRVALPAAGPDKATKAGQEF